MDVVVKAKRVYVAEEIVTDIMTRLRDGRSIVRFRCVSKQYCRLLSVPNFIHRVLWSDGGHSKEEEDKHSTQILITRRRQSFGRDRFRFIYSILSYDDVTGALRPVITKVNKDVRKDHKDGLVDLEYLGLPAVPGKFREPPYEGRSRFYVVGCCDGIICVADQIPCEPADIILWIPSTSEVKILPTCSNRSKISLEQLGFGFDSKSQDYKVVRTLVFDPSLISFTEVYSLRNDSWRKHDYAVNYDKEEHNPPYRSVVQSPESKCERVYWYNPNGQGFKGIASFDMRTEEFVNHKYPMSLRRSMKGGDRALSDGMELVATPRESTMVAVFGDPRRVYQIWGLLDFQIPESWIKLFTISQFSVSDVDSVLGPLGKSRNYLFLKKEGGLFTFNPETQEITDVPGIQAISERCSSHELNLLVATYSYV